MISPVPHPHQMLALSTLFAKAPQPRPVWGMPRPHGRIALTISGAISWPNHEAGVAFDAELLREFETRSIQTSTDWDWQTGLQTFQGVAVADLLLAAGWRGNRVIFSATDGYEAEASTDELRDGGAVVATDFNGMPLPCTRYGPLWLVFPFDQARSRIERWHQTQRSVWSLTRMVVT
jgi:hypothetical protein